MPEYQNRAKDKLKKEIIKNQAWIFKDIQSAWTMTTMERLFLKIQTAPPL
jgi:hypothetical protein